MDEQVRLEYRIDEQWKVGANYTFDDAYAHLMGFFASQIFGALRKRTRCSGANTHWHTGS